MTETLLLLNGQTVILTRDEAESLVQNGASVIDGIRTHGNQLIQKSHKDKYTPLTTAQCRISPPPEVQVGDEIDSDNQGSSFVQVKVNGREIPGFVLNGIGSLSQTSKEQCKNIHDVLVHHASHNSSAALSKVSEGSGITTSQYIPTNNDPDKLMANSNGLTKQTNQESYSGEVYTLSAGSNLLQTHVQQSRIGNEFRNLNSIVKFPLVSSGTQSLHEKEKEMSEMANSSANGHTIVAIIHGDDGRSQSIEFPVEGDSYQLSIPHTMKQKNAADQSVSKVSEKFGESLLASQAITENSSTQMFKFGSCDEGMQDDLPNNTSIFIGESTEKVIVKTEKGKPASGCNEGSLEPILIIPDYGSDSSTSTLQITNSTSSASLRTELSEVKEASAVVKPVHNITRQVNGNLQPKSTSLLFPYSCTQEGRQSKILLQKQNWKSGSSSKVNHLDWKQITPKFRSIPKVPGSTYLRDIAKRTKFQNLSSLLDSKQNELHPNICVEQAVVPPQSSASEIQVSLPKVDDIGANPPQKLNMQLPLQLPIKTIASTSIVNKWHSAAVESKAVTELHDDKTLTIRVNTGSIYEKDASSVNDGPSFSPGPSIRCEGNDGLIENLPPLTSIVYCSSEGDEPPQIVHLPSGDATKPLGSSENPIQLVQQGNTFQALQPVNKEQLEQITALLQQRRLSVPLTAHHDEIYDPKTNMKIVYKVVYPDKLHKESESSEESDFHLESIALPKKKRRGRPSIKSRSTRIESTAEDEDVNVDVLEPKERKAKLPVSRTRSGRISRPPQHKMVDFKHILPANFNDARDTYVDYEPQEVDLKETENVFYKLDTPRKKRGLSEALRLRYSCHTCKKLFVGRIEKHYENFPNHRRDPPLVAKDLNHSYSAIKAHSNVNASDSNNEGEVGKPVLSPTPGTRASETNGEPSLPMETSATLLDRQQMSLKLGETAGEHLFTGKDQDLQESNQLGEGDKGGAPLLYDPPLQPANIRPNGRRGRGRGRRRGRGRWKRTPSSVRPATETASQLPSGATDFVALPTKNVAELANQPAENVGLAEGVPVLLSKNFRPSNIMFEQIFSSHSIDDILDGVSKRLSECFSPWQLLCAFSDRRSSDSNLHQWQKRFDSLRRLLKQCKDECGEQLDPLPDLLKEGGSCCACTKRKKNEDSDLHVKKSKEDPDSQDINLLSFEDLLKDTGSPLKSDVSYHIQVYDDIASAIGISAGCYTLKQPSCEPSTSVSSLIENSVRLPADGNLYLSNSNLLTSGSNIVDSSASLPQPSGGLPISNKQSCKRSLEDETEESRSDKKVKVHYDGNNKSMMEGSAYVSYSKVDACSESSSFDANSFSTNSVDVSMVQNSTVSSYTTKTVDNTKVSSNAYSGKVNGNMEVSVVNMMQNKPSESLSIGNIGIIQGTPTSVFSGTLVDNMEVNSNIINPTPSGSSAMSSKKMNINNIELLKNSSPDTYSGKLDDNMQVSRINMLPTADPNTYIGKSEDMKECGAELIHNTSANTYSGKLVSSMEVSSISVMQNSATNAYSGKLGEDMKISNADLLQSTPANMYQEKVSNKLNVSNTSIIQSTSGSTYTGKSCENIQASNDNIMQNTTQSLQLSTFVDSSVSSLNPNPIQTSSLPVSTILTTCDVSGLTTSLSSSNINLLLNSETVVSDTTPTMSYSTPCVSAVPPVSSANSNLPLQVSSFPTHTNVSDTSLSGCIQMSNVDNSLINMSAIPQESTSQQIGIGDLDITAEDLPRLLSEGMGIVVNAGGDGSGDGCDVPKLLDTSGDTTDLSEMLFKLQEATVGMSQSQEPNLVPSSYTEQVITSSEQHLNVHPGQHSASQSLSTPSGPSLSSQSYGTIGQSLTTHTTPSLNEKTLLMQSCSQTPAPLLTFTGALSRNSDYCSVSPSLSQQPINHVGESKCHQGIIDQPSSVHCEQLGKTESSLCVERDSLSIDFPVTSLSNSELEDILKR